MAKSKSKPALPKTSPAPDRNLEQDLARVRGFAELMQAHQLGEITWEEDLKKITLRSKDFAQTAGGPLLQAAPYVQPAPAVVSTPTASLQEQAAAEPPKGKVLASPFVGTFYGSPSPTAEPYIRVGGKVKPGDVLCIVEAMKLMNEIEAEIGGTVLAIHAQNGQPVEFGEPLFTIA